MNNSILGMSSPQYISDATIIGALPGTSPSDLNPGSSGVNFNQPNASVTISFTPGTTPIVVEVSVPNTNTNVNQTTVVITAPNGTVIVNAVSPPGTNSVTQFPLLPLPENSTITITFQTNNGSPPQNVTISVIACYTPSSATTIMTTGTVPPSVTGSTPTLTISSSTTVVTTGPGEIFKSIIRPSQSIRHFLNADE
jgi:uncharacterized membrane protein